MTAVRRNRRALLAALAACAVTFGLPPATSGATAPEVVISGRGWGHGVGMAQDGAYWMGMAGASTQQILGHFYPGTTMGRRSGTVRVDVFTSRGPATLIDLPGGGEIRDALARFKELLGGRDYLWGEDFSAADVAAFPFLKYATRWDEGDDERFHLVLREWQELGDGFGRLRAWIARVDARPRA